MIHCIRRPLSCSLYTSARGQTRRSVCNAQHVHAFPQTADRSSTDGAMLFPAVVTVNVVCSVHEGLITRWCRRMLRRLHPQPVLHPATAVISREPTAAPTTTASASTLRPSLQRLRSSRRSGRPVVRRSAATASDNGWVCSDGSLGGYERVQCTHVTRAAAAVTLSCL